MFYANVADYFHECVSNQVEKELRDICQDILDVLDKHLIPSRWKWDSADPGIYLIWSPMVSGQIILKYAEKSSKAFQQFRCHCSGQFCWSSSFLGIKISIWAQTCTIAQCTLNSNTFARKFCSENVFGSEESNTANFCEMLFCHCIWICWFPCTFQINNTSEREEAALYLWYYYKYQSRKISWETIILFVWRRLNNLVKDLFDLFLSTTGESKVFYYKMKGDYHR